MPAKEEKEEPGIADKVKEKARLTKEYVQETGGRVKEGIIGKNNE